MPELSRRTFIAAALAMAAAPAWASRARRSHTKWVERRELFPQGVASADPAPDNVLLWTRRPGNGPVSLTVEVAEDSAFDKVVASAPAIAAPESDWTVRVLVGGLKPRREYWYRFTGPDGSGSRIGRTLTAPADHDGRPVKFAYVSCQNVAQGAQNAYWRIIWEDKRAEPDERLGFVLHLGDFIYEVTWYPEDRPQGMYDRRLRDLVRFPNGERVKDFHLPTTLEDYRTVYRAFLQDPDLQDARARFPFVCMWDNHEFSWNGWQSVQVLDDNIPAQQRKVAANQAWFEFVPARVVHAGNPLGPFKAPAVKNAPVAKFDDSGLGQEANNLAAIGSLTTYRAFRYGRHVDLIITDQFSYRSREPTSHEEAKPLWSDDFPNLIAQSALEILDAGRHHNGGQPPETINFGSVAVPNFRKNEPAQTLLGAKQKAWFLRRLRSSTATWKVWGLSQPALDFRADLQNIPVGWGKPWPEQGYAALGGGDFSTAYTERAEIYDLIKHSGITGFVSVAGDPHAFWAGIASKALPPKSFEPVGLSFITGSISAPTLVEAFEYRFAKEHPLRPLFLADRPGKVKPDATFNMLLKHGVRSCFEYARSGDAVRARALSNPDNAPHLSFVDMGGHGYATMRFSANAVESEFVCLPRPLERSTSEDGGPVRYRVVHRALLWKAGEAPTLDQRIIEGDVSLSI